MPAPNMQPPQGQQWRCPPHAGSQDTDGVFGPTFSISKLPRDARNRYEKHLDPSYLMALDEMGAYDSVGELFFHNETLTGNQMMT